MKKIVFVLIPYIIILGIVIYMVSPPFEFGFPKAAQSLLDQQGWTVVTISRARHPAALRQEIVYTVDNDVYQRTRPEAGNQSESTLRAGESGQEALDQPEALTYTLNFTAAEGQSPRSRPASSPRRFPPEQVWCVLLAGDPELDLDPWEATRRRIVFVAYHTEVYQANWYIHRLYDAGKLKATLAELGCDLGELDLNF